MKRILFIFMLMTPLFALSGNKTGFAGIGLGPKFQPNLVVAEDVSAYIFIGKELRSASSYFGSVALGLTFPDFDINYSYTFLKINDWSLGITTSFLFGSKTVSEWTDLNSENIKLVLNFGGRVGSYLHLRITRRIALGIEIGGIISNFHPGTQFINGPSIYTNFNLRFYF